MRIVQVALFIAALVCGVTAMGCWVLTQGDAAIAKDEGPKVLLIMVLSSMAFLLFNVASAFLRNSNHSVHSLLARALFLIGACGIVVLLFFVIASKGMIFGFGALPLAFLASFILLTGIFRPRNRNTIPAAEK